MGIWIGRAYRLGRYVIMLAGVMLLIFIVVKILNLASRPLVREFAINKPAGLAWTSAKEAVVSVFRDDGSPTNASQPVAPIAGHGEQISQVNDPGLIPAEAATVFTPFSKDKDVILVKLYTWNGGHKFQAGGFVQVTQRSTKRWGVILVKAGTPTEFSALRGEEYYFRSVSWYDPKEDVAHGLGPVCSVLYSGAPAGYARQVELEGMTKNGSDL